MPEAVSKVKEQKTPFYNECRSGKPHHIQWRCPMDDLSLAHSRYNCMYHIVFIPKYRRKTMFGALRREVGEI